MMQTIKTYRSYFIIVLVFAIIGTLVAGTAQPGGINHLNGFIAPIIGPWSKILPPNAARLKNWTQDNYLFAIPLSLVTLVFVVVSPIPKNRVVRIITKVFAHLAVVFWCLCGLSKVMIELT